MQSLPANRSRNLRPSPGIAIQLVAWSAILGSSAIHAAAGDVIWDGSCDNNWHTCCNLGGGTFENNWDFGPGGSCPLPLPGLADDVDLGGADVVLDQTTVEINSLHSTGIFTLAGVHIRVTEGVTLNEFNLGGGTLNPGTSVVINGPFAATGGELRRLGLPADPPIPAQFLGGMSVPTFLGVRLGGLTITCPEAVQWLDGPFDLNEGTTFDSQDMFVVECDRTMGNAAPAATFVNNGTFTKRVTTGQTLITERVGFESNGAVNVETGTLRLENATGFSRNVFTVSDGATLEFAQFGAGQFTLDDGTSLAGSGTVRSTSSALIIPENVAVGANNFELAGGNLKGPGSLVVLFLLWNNGAIDGAQVEAISTLDLNGFLTKTITNGGLLENAGQGLWQGSGSLFINDGSFRNRNTFTINDNSAIVLRCSMNSPDAEFHNDTGATVHAMGEHIEFSGNNGRIVNDGNWFTTAETLEFELPLHQNGLMQMQSGSATIRLAGGGESTGTFETAGLFGSLVFLGRPYTLKVGTQITGDGRVELLGSGEIIVPSALGTVPIECAFNQIGGTVSGDGNLLLDSTVGVSNWFGGMMRGLGTTTVSRDTQFFITDGTSIAAKTVDQRELILDSFNAVFSGAGDLLLHNGARLHVLFGAKLSVSGTDGPQDIANGSGGDDGVVTIDGDLDVNNLLRVDANTIFNIHGTANLLAELWLSGGGDFTDGLIAGPAAFELRGDTFTFDDTFVLGPIMRIKGGIADVITTAEVDRVELSNGAIDGPGEFINDQSFEWTGGAMRGAGITTLNGAASLTGGNKFLMQRTINNRGSGLTWSAGTLTASNGGIINNFAPFEIAGSPSLQATAGAGVINNHSTFFKSADAGQTNIFVPFNQSGGEVRCDAGTLRFAAAYSQTGGVTRFGTGGNLVFSQSLLLLGGVATGSGATTANIVNTGGIVRPGNTPGLLSITGSYSQSDAGVLEIELAGLVPGSEHDALEITGSATLGGTLDVRLIDGFVPQAGDSFVILTAGLVSGQFSDVIVSGAPPRLDLSVTYDSGSVVLEFVQQQPDPSGPPTPRPPVAKQPLPAP